MSILLQPRRKRRSYRIRIGLICFLLGMLAHWGVSSHIYRDTYRVTPEAFHEALKAEAEYQLAIIISDSYDPALLPPERKPK